MGHTLHVPGEQALWREAGRGFGRLFRASAGFEWWQSPTASLAVSGIPAPDLNCGLVDAGEAVAENVAAVAGRLRDRRLPGLVLVTDAAGDEGRSAAAAAGLVPVARMPLMAMAATALCMQPSPFTVRRVAHAADLSAANRVMAAAFELPPDQVEEAFPAAMLSATDIRVDLVLDGDEPVGALQTTSEGGLTGIWSMATLPNHRRRGIARVGLADALARRFSEGCHTAFLIATEAGRPLYDAIGFKVVAWSDAWLCERNSRFG